MNFNFLLLLTLIFVFSCGVKGDPRAPDGTNLPDVQKRYQTKIKKTEKK